MKPLGKAIRTARAENRNWVQELLRFLLSYRTTPHSSTRFPPAQLLFNRPVREILPMLNPNNKVLNRHRARDYANKRRHAKSSNLKVGDKVIPKQRKRNKFITKFELKPYRKIERKGSKVVAKNGRHRVTRNTSFFKKIKGDMREPDEDEILNEQTTTACRNEQRNANTNKQPSGSTSATQIN